MKNKHTIKIKVMCIGFLLIACSAGSAYAASKIKSAEYNSNKVVYNGKALDMSSQSMISVIDEGESNASNYMPLRSVLEQMGYEVTWDGKAHTVFIDDVVKENQEGKALQEDLFVQMGIDEQSSAYKDFEDSLSFLREHYGFDDGVLTLLVANDYQIYQEGGEAIFADLWDEVNG